MADKTNRAKLQLEKVTYIFDYDPKDFSIDFTQDLAANQVLDTLDPDIRSKSVSTVYSLSGCLLISQGLNVSQKVKLEQLKSLMLARKSLKFTYGTVLAGSVYIASMQVKILQWVKSEPAHVEVDLTLKSARETPGVKEQKVAVTNTPRMQSVAQGKITDLLKSPLNQKKYGQGASATVTVDAQGNATVNGKQYKLSDFNL